MARKDEKESKAPEEVQTGGWEESVKVRFRKFNGPAAASEPLRIAMGKDVYAELIGHAKETLDREICGVLLGDLCEDEYGLFLNVDASLRGGAAKAGGTHVTFTQETWNEIHKAKEERYPKLHIVGWYHSHPGFGVEFSDMDRFIQKNFFGGPGQIAFVSDPLGGQEAIDANVDGQLTAIGRFWVDGRERKCYVPASSAAAGDGERVNGAGAGSGATAALPAEVGKTLEDLRDRIRQLTEAVEQQRTFFYNTLTFVGMLVAVCVILGVGYSMWRAYYRPIQPPDEMDLAQSIPMVIDGKPSLVQLAVKRWEMSPEVQEQMLKQLLAVLDAKHKAEAAATQDAGTAPASGSATVPAGTAVTPAPAATMQGPAAGPPAPSAPVNATQAH